MQTARIAQAGVSYASNLCQRIAFVRDCKSPAIAFGLKKSESSYFSEAGRFRLLWTKRDASTRTSFIRLTNAFSKKVENHCYTIALHFVYYNFCKVHKTLRVTPAMEAKLAVRPMTIEDIANLAPIEPPKTCGKYKTKKTTEEPNSSPFCYLSFST